MIFKAPQNSLNLTADEMKHYGWTDETLQKAGYLVHTVEEIEAMTAQLINAANAAGVWVRIDLVSLNGGNLKMVPDIRAKQVRS